MPLDFKPSDFTRAHADAEFNYFWRLRNEAYSAYLAQAQFCGVAAPEAYGAAQDLLANLMTFRRFVVFIETNFKGHYLELAEGVLWNMLACIRMADTSMADACKGVLVAMQDRMRAEQAEQNKGAK